MAHVPEPPQLVCSETRDAYFALLADIRGADTLRELNLYWKRAADAQREFRAFFTSIETEIRLKIDEFARADAAVVHIRRGGEAHEH